MRSTYRASVFLIVLALAACDDSKTRGRKDEQSLVLPVAAFTTTIARGRLLPGAVPGLPDGTIEELENCYTEGLRSNPSQKGRIRFSVTPPPDEGPVGVVLDADGSLEAGVVTCARSALGSIHSYKGRGRSQPFVTATLELEPELQQVPELPTSAALRRVLDDEFAEDGVVKVLRVDVARVRHRKSFTTLLREFEYKVDLEFLRAGFEVRCFHGRSWKEFRKRRFEDTGTAQCENVPRRKGDRAEDQAWMHFRLTTYGWQAGYEKAYYCGDARCPR